MKKYISLQNLALIIALTLFAFKQGPSIANSFRLKEKNISKRPVKTIEANPKSIQFPPDKKVVTFFWMTTCTPCKIEMLRLKKSVESGKISKGSIYAVNPFESTAQIKKFLKKNPYPFTFIEDNDLGHDLVIQATPTTVFLDNAKVKYFSTGISFMGIYKAENFISK
ncbi:TlpA family protein disulfide reductase [Halobacteriovorax sp. CON-3]|uniref:TlpA family protein disulfide reductase n=1 Tax=Halobacteriovorax sp. CON-3 TaxID=3157710 RepID=UPI00371E94B9